MGTVSSTPTGTGRDYVDEYVAVEAPHARIDGVLRHVPGRASRTVLLETHPRRDSFQNMFAWPMTALPAHGVDTLAFNNRFTNSAAGIDVATIWERFVLDVGAAVRFARDRGYDHVLLYGTSAGGPLVSYYQRVAEDGSGLAGDRIGPLVANWLPEVTVSGEDLPPADGLVLQNATSGPAHSFLIRLDPSIVDEHDVVRDASLDMFDPDNGFDPGTGTGTYSADFLLGYYSAQAERMDKLITEAQERLASLRESHSPFVDDTFIVIPRIRACPAFVDLGVAHETRSEHRLLPYGDKVVVTSDRPIVRDAAAANRTCNPGTAVHTLSSFLSYRAVGCRTDEYDPFKPGELAGATDASCTGTADNLHLVRAPTLITQGTADIEVHLPTAESNFEAAGAADRELVFISEAAHDMTNGAGGQVDTRRTHLDAVRSWIQQRFG